MHDFVLISPAYPEYWIDAIRAADYYSVMKWSKWLRWLPVLLAVFCLRAEAATARIIKVLPQFLDKAGRQSLSPSLYERDAYQAHLRKNPEACSGLSYKVQWRAPGVSSDAVKIRLELRTSGKNDFKPLVIEQPVKSKGLFSRWTTISVEGETFKEMGAVMAWRVTLWKDGQQIGEQKSFLW
jgi:hypothetical protein